MSLTETQLEVLRRLANGEELMYYAYAYGTPSHYGWVGIYGGKGVRKSTIDILRENGYIDLVSVGRVCRDRIVVITERGMQVVSENSNYRKIKKRCK
jgi:hypothetical protein